jgi:hypothetical protein
MAVYFDQNGNLVDTEISESSDVLPPNPFLSPGTPDDAYANLLGLPANQDMGYLLGVPETSNAGYLIGTPGTADDVFPFQPPGTADDRIANLIGTPGTADDVFPYAPANRLEGLPSLDLQSLPANMGVANEADVEQEFLPGQKKSSGIMDLIMSIAVPGFSLLRNMGQGIQGLNQRVRNTDFGQSRTGTEYMMRRRERKQAERAQEAMPDVYRSAREQGFTNDRGGFSTSRADRAGTSLGSGQFSSKRSTGRQGY